jgi:hypothetical protein
LARLPRLSGLTGLAGLSGLSGHSRLTTAANRHVNIDQARAAANADADIHKAATTAGRAGTDIGRNQGFATRPHIGVENVAGAPAQTNIDQSTVTSGARSNRHQGTAISVPDDTKQAIRVGWHCTTGKKEAGKNSYESTFHDVSPVLLNRSVSQGDTT